MTTGASDPRRLTTPARSDSEATPLRPPAPESPAPLFPAARFGDAPPAERIRDALQLLRTAPWTPAPWLRKFHVGDVEAIEELLTRALADLERPLRRAPALPTLEELEAEGDSWREELEEPTGQNVRHSSPRDAAAVFAARALLLTIAGAALALLMFGCSRPPVAPPCMTADTTWSTDCVLRFIVTAPCGAPITITNSRTDCPPRSAP